MTDNPLVPDREAQTLLHQRAMAEKADKARTVGDWFDIFTEIVEHSVKDIFESNGAGAEGLERIKNRRVYWKRVKEELVAHGAPLSEDIELEGPVVLHDDRGVPCSVQWPQGEWIRLYWPDGSRLEFRGEKAQVALTFIQWWENFQAQYKMLHDPSKLTKRRIINPGEPEWNSYMAAKNRDQKKGLEPR